jgi:hypothetical protein
VVRPQHEYAPDRRKWLLRAVVIKKGPGMPESVTVYSLWTGVAPSLALHMLEMRVLSRVSRAGPEGIRGLCVSATEGAREG